MAQQEEMEITIHVRAALNQVTAAICLIVKEDCIKGCNRADMLWNQEIRVPEAHQRPEYQEAIIELNKKIIEKKEKDDASIE